MGPGVNSSIGVVEVPLVMEATWNFAEIQTGHQECGMTWEVTTREALCAIILLNPKMFACFFLLIKLAQNKLVQLAFQSIQIHISHQLYSNILNG